MVAAGSQVGRGLESASGPFPVVGLGRRRRIAPRQDGRGLCAGIGEVVVEISGKNIIVTGGANGIGRALCERFAREGAASIVVVDLDESNAQKVASGIGGRARRVDVSRRDEIEALVRDVESEAGPVDLFVSNAGIAIEGGP